MPYSGKTNWKYDEIVRETDLNRIEQGLVDAHQVIDSLPSFNEVAITSPIMNGVNVITTDMASPLAIEVKGNILTNILKDYGTIKDNNGDGIADGPWRTSPVGDGKFTVQNGYQKIESVTTDTKINERYIATNHSAGHFSVKAGEKFVMIADVETDGVSNARISCTLGTGNGSFDAITTTSRTIFGKGAVSSDASNAYVAAANRNGVGVVGWVAFKDISLYKVSDEIYNAIGVTINESNIRQYLPQLDGTKCIEGVSITKRGKNLLPPFSKWDTKGAPITIKSSYDASVILSSDKRVLSLVVAVMKNTTYTLSAKHNAMIAVYGTPVLSGGAIVHYTKAQTVTFNSGNRESVTILFSPDSMPDGTYEIADTILSLGSSVEPFEPQNDDTVVLPTTLAKLGNVTDRLYWRDGAWKVQKSIKRDFVLDGSLNWSQSGQASGVKRLVVPTTPKGSPSLGSILVSTRYDGKEILHQTTAAFLPDTNQITADGVYHIVIPNNLSGWVDTIDPTAAEAKACMNGWMATANNGSAYTSWVSILDGSVAPTNTVAWVSVNKAKGWKGWAEVSYVLAAPVEEQISVGGLALHSGVNQIEVDTGYYRNAAGQMERTASANITHATASYVIGISGVLSDTVQNVADNMAQDARQDDWLLLNEAKTADVRHDLDLHTTDSDLHVTAVKQAVWDAKETPAGAQAKADGALAAAKTHADTKETPTGAQTKANQAEQRAKDASLPRGGGRLSGPLGIGTDPAITLAIGDGDTGFNWARDGEFNVMANNVKVGHVNAQGIHIDRDIVLRGTTQAAVRLNGQTLEYWNGSEWKSVGGGVYVASHTVRHTFPEWTSTQEYQYMLVGKFVPVTTGEIVIRAEVQATYSYGGRLYVDQSSISLDYNTPSAGGMSHTNNGGSTHHAAIDWRIPLGTVMGYPRVSYRMGEIINTNNTTGYVWVEKVYHILNPTPIYFFIERARIRNLTISYDTAY
ncbi:hypothetical protein [Paenibacillus arenosi]|uniref:Uncharacterized protein n=1 Tax=Paenibacillus arenosi TaxID=2774142 RepID=A0ABR9B0Q4_9BACL|nr:hypothetical protein [Paenibacillus arenosi]MBD8499975.1 hypothetical protein [Paenibacillus arenosi]